MDQSSPPWRVFDAPAAAQGASARPDDGEVGTFTGALAGRRLALAGLAASLLIGALAVVVAIGSTGPRVVVGPDASSEGGTNPSEGALAGGQLVVDITGAVVAPGVYRLTHGSRVGDAIDAAGGYGLRVDVARVAQELNLAATLTDGQQVHVPSRDDPHHESGGAGGGSAGSGGSGGGADSLVDLNRATQDELEALPGIGPVTAGKIIEARAQAPFRSVDELRERGLVGEKTFASIRALITVA